VTAQVSGVVSILSTRLWDSRTRPTLMGSTLWIPKDPPVALALDTVDWLAETAMVKPIASPVTLEGPMH